MEKAWRKRSRWQVLQRAVWSKHFGLLEGSNARSRFLRRISADKVGIASCIAVVAIVVLALTAPWISPYPPLAIDTSGRLQPPSSIHLMGTDDLGRDLFTRVLWGARVSLRLAGIVVVFAVTLGVAIGATSGFLGGIIDDIAMRVTDVFLAFPYLVLAMAFSAMLGPSVTNAALALGLVWWPSYARLMRGQVLSVKQRDFVEAGRAVGATPWRLVARHIAPNCLDPIWARMILTAGNAILAGAALSFIGLGAQPPTAEWGLMVSIGRDYFLTAWWFPTLTGLAIVVTVLAFTLAGDAIQDALNVHIRR